MNNELNPTNTMELDTLDETVIKGLKFLAESNANNGIPRFEDTPAAKFERPLLIGSGLSENTLAIMYDGQTSFISNESNYQAEFEKWKDVGVDGIVIMSISGGKHSPSIASWASQQGLDTVLLTCNPQTQVLNDPNIQGVVFPSPSRHATDKKTNPTSDPEPLTYNFATYTSFMISRTGEDAKKALDYINNVVKPIVDGFHETRDLGSYSSFFGMVSTKFNLLANRGIVKFQELFSQQYGVDFCTVEDAKHAKTVVPTLLHPTEEHTDPNSDTKIEYKKELFMTFGTENEVYGNSEDRLNIPLPEGAGYATATAVLYYVVGRIQKELPALYKFNVANYAEVQGQLFGSKMNLLQDYHAPKVN